MTTGRDRYIAERVATASPEQLVKMLFDRAVAELQLAQQDLEAGNRREASPRIRKAQDIVNELRCSLDLTQGEIATNLDDLYGFAFNELLEAVLDGEPRHIEGVIAIIDPVRDAWNQACCGLEPVT